MLVGQFGDLAASGCAAYEALLDEEWLVHFLDGAGVLAHRGGDGGDAYGAALELVDDGEQDFVVNLVEAVLVDVERFEGVAGNGHVDAARALDLRKVAHTAQQGVGNARRAT